MDDALAILTLNCVAEEEEKQTTIRVAIREAFRGGYYCKIARSVPWTIRRQLASSNNRSEVLVFRSHGLILARIVTALLILLHWCRHLLRKRIKRWIPLRLLLLPLRKKLPLSDLGLFRMLLLPKTRESLTIVPRLLPITATTTITAQTTITTMIITHY